MRIDKSNIEDSSKKKAQRMLNQIRNGQRVFGNPAEGLKLTLKDLDEKRREKEKNPTEFELEDADIKGQIAKVKAGINGEESLAGYLEKLIKLDDNLDGIVAFASLSTEADAIAEKGYIPDTDFIIVYGRNLLILDAKNIRTHPENPVFLLEGALKNMNSVIIEDVIPSTYFWESHFKNMRIPIGAVDEFIVIYNTSGATILKNAEWHASKSKPIHVSELQDTLTTWMEGKDGTASLELLTYMSETQIKKPKSDMDLSQAFGRFKL